MPFKSAKQKTYLAINEPDVYKKFKKEEKMMYGNKMSKKMYGGKVEKKAMGGKVYKVDNSGQMMVQRMYGGKVKNEY